MAISEAGPSGAERSPAAAANRADSFILDDFALIERRARRDRSEAMGELIANAIVAVVRLFRGRSAQAAPAERSAAARRAAARAAA